VHNYTLGTEIAPYLKVQPNTIKV